MSQKKFEILERETLFQGYFRVDRFQIRHETFAGGWSSPYRREVFDRGLRAVAVLLFDPEQDKIAMVEQLRPAPLARGEDPWMIELVAGIVESGETDEQTIRREAVEEANCEITALEKIAAYYASPGCMSEFTTLFVGRTSGLEDGVITGLAEENEEIRLHVMDAVQAMSLLYTRRLRDAHSMIAMQWFALHHTDLRSRWLVSETSTPII
jgi:ADP-ribose pyrophosphatase